MIRNDSRSGNRLAFTLVELMVVVLIIAILVSLVSSAVMKAMQKIPEVQTRTEITEMEVALRAFMSDYNLTDPPPSKLILYENMGLYATSTVPGAAQSYAFLQKVFGKNLGPQVDWNGDGIISPTILPWVLEGEHCLVFYIGGIPSPAGGPQGFSTNNMKPSFGSMAGETPGKRKGPYFTFVTPRLIRVPLVGGFYVYVDPWQSKASPFYAMAGGTPYAFFSSSGINNGYNYTDCALGLQFPDALGRKQIALPYYTAVSPTTPGLPTAYANSNTFQIISAGKDGIFGYNLVPPSPVPPPPTGIPNNNLWSPAGGASGTGADDQANFSGSLLGSGQS